MESCSEDEIQQLWIDTLELSDRDKTSHLMFICDLGVDPLSVSDEVYKKIGALAYFSYCSPFVQNKPHAVILCSEFNELPSFGPYFESEIGTKVSIGGVKYSGDLRIQKDNYRQVSRISFFRCIRNLEHSKQIGYAVVCNLSDVINSD